jgi:magnesium and cobalt transporter
MADTSDGRPAELPAESADGDPDSPERQGFFTRLFRRETSETADDDDGAGQAAADASRGAREMLVNLRNMRNMRVDDVSVPRPDIEAVFQDASLEEVLAIFQSSTNSRLPVYAETLDQPVGLVHLKDLALKYGFGASSEGFDLRGLLRPLLYAPPSMPIGVLLQKMQAARIHMALVIDEYGGVDGLVTIEDLLEQIVGDIADEHDEDEGLLWTLESPGVYIAQPRVDLDEFEAETGIRLADGELAEETDTLGGLVYRLAGRVPARGEVVMHPDGHEFEVVDADARRIKRMRVRLRAPGLAAEAAE